MIGMGAIFVNYVLTITSASRSVTGSKENEMNTQTESIPVVTISKEAIKTDNPMQECFCGEVTEFIGITAEAAFMARRLETHAKPGRSIRADAGLVFVP